MIRQPRPGQHVHLRYAPPKRSATPGLHLAQGIVRTVGQGPGPHNCLVEIGDGRLVVTTRGQLTDGWHCLPVQGVLL